MMIRNYFRIALRNIKRHKAFSIINMLGLSIGISAAVIVFLIARYEFGFDKFEQDRDRIYRVVADLKFNDVEGHSAAVPAPLGGAVQNEVSGVELAVPVFQFQGDATAKVTVQSGSADDPVIYKKQPDIVFTNQQYFRLLSYRWMAGSREGALQNPFSVVLTENRARQYFPSLPLAGIVGKQLTYNDEIKATVTGIVEDLNGQTDFTGKEFLSLPTILETNLKDHFMMDVWDDWMAYSQLYVKLSDGYRPENTEIQLKALLKKYNKEANKDRHNTLSFHLQPLDEMHFDSKYAGFGQKIAHKSTLYGLFAIAAFLLLLGCINFINLTTAQAVQRAKEIGIRKTMGSSKGQLVRQFLTETLFITFIATTLSVLMVPFLMKCFSAFIPADLHFDLLHQPSLLFFLLLLIAAVSFLSGLYPALILTRYKPVMVLKNQTASVSGQTRNAIVRKVLTTSQFVIAQFFVIATVMVSRQIHYVLNKDLGFKKDAILTFQAPSSDTVVANRLRFLNEVKAIPGVQTASMGFVAPAEDGASFTNITYNRGGKEIKVNVQIRWGDTGYLNLYHIRLLAGRNIVQSDTIREFIINETYAKLLGFKDPGDAINKQLDFNGKKLPIVGVMHDFNEQSLHNPIGPVVFASFNDRSYFFHVALKPSNTAGTTWQSVIGKLATVYHGIYPEADFSYTFFDDTIARFYKRERNISRLLGWTTGIAIFISCLGLLGLTIYTSNIRQKEISVRKILGASVMHLVTVLSKDFVLLVLVAFVIAAPVAWWSAHEWLQNFAYRVTMSWWVFLLCGGAMLLISIITLSVQTVKTATANPVGVLRNE